MKNNICVPAILFMLTLTSLFYAIPLYADDLYSSTKSTMSDDADISKVVPADILFDTEDSYLSVAEEPATVPDNISENEQESSVTVETDAAQVTEMEDDSTITAIDVSENVTSLSDETTGDAEEKLFNDVKNPSHPFFTAIYWARSNNIAKGYSGTNTFGINDTCTRGQIIFLLWKMAGRPAPSIDRNPFKDIKSNDAFYKAILWAYSTGMAKGYSDHTFKRDEPCTRGQIVTFLWRYYGMPESSLAKSPFSDTITPAYKKAVLWCYEYGIVKGFSNGTFGDTQKCTRGQAVYMLYRSYDIPRLILPSQGTFSALTSSASYTGNPLCPQVELYYHNTPLTQGIDYDVEYQNNTLPGNAAILIYVTGEWTGTIRRSFKIMLSVPSITSLKSNKNGQIGIKWSKCQYVSGYQIKYYTGTTIKTLTVNGQQTSKTITGVSRNTKYLVSVRSFLSTNGKKFFSSWSNPKSLTTRNMYWKITQYASVTGNQSMAYSITDPNGRLIMIDGGWEQDANHIRSIVQSNGNHVYAWIVTHPHPDHVGALNKILSNNTTGMRIDHIYTPKINSTRYEETKRDYDRIETYRTFKKLTQNLNTVSWLKEGDKFSVLGLTFTVLHAWDKEVDTFKSNLCNYGSLMFMVNGEQEKMLFCADAERAVQNSIINRHKNELSADFVQVAHHGNWGLTASFYNIVQARVAFFDAPSWIVNDTSGKYNAPILKKHLQAAGTKIYYFVSAPNTITLH